MALAREYTIYDGPSPVKTRQPIRKLLDVVGQWGKIEERGRAVFDKTSGDSPCLVLEWMDHDLQHVRAEPYREKSVLPNPIAQLVLEALDLFASASAMPTGQLYLLRDHFGGAEKVRYQCEQHILVIY